MLACDKTCVGSWCMWVRLPRAQRSAYARGVAQFPIAPTRLMGALCVGRRVVTAAIRAVGAPLRAQRSAYARGVAQLPIAPRPPRVIRGLLGRILPALRSALLTTLLLRASDHRLGNHSIVGAHFLAALCEACKGQASGDGQLGVLLEIHCGCHDARAADRACRMAATAAGVHRGGRSSCELHGLLR